MNSPTSPSPKITEPNIALVDPPNPWEQYRLPILIGVIITVIGMVAWYARMGSIKAVASGSIVRVMMYPVHTVYNQDDPTDQGPGMPGAPLSQDQILVLSQVQIKNTSDKPLSIFDLSAKLTLPSEQRESMGASTGDIDRLFQAFPDLAPLRMEPLARHQVIAPGQTAEGLVVFNYPITQAQWNLRRDLQISVSFDNGLPVVLDNH